MIPVSSADEAWKSANGPEALAKVQAEGDEESVELSRDYHSASLSAARSSVSAVLRVDHDSSSSFAAAIQ
jgi:hypothetical protein